MALSFEEQESLLKQDNLLRMAGYRPHHIKDRSHTTAEFYSERWRNLDISQYWRRMCCPPVCDAKGYYVYDRSGVLENPLEEEAACAPSRI